MTVAAAHEVEHRLTEQVARQLVEEGYDVLLEPSPLLLPRELAGHRPNILARRGDENLLVEVKLVPSPAGAEQVQRLIQAVRSLPGWEVRLVTAPRPEPTSPWSVAEGEARLAEAERLAGQGYQEAALILLVAAAEALGRRLGTVEQVRVQPWSPATLFRELIFHGLIDREDAERLERAIVARNQIIHGIADENVDPAEVAGLVEAVRRLAAEAREAESGVRGSDAPPPEAA